MSPPTSELISAVGHPLRRRILSAFLGGTFPGGFSAQDLALVLERPVKQVDYHLKALATSDILRRAVAQGEGPPEVRYGWSLGIEEAWLRAVLELSLPDR